MSHYYSQDSIIGPLTPLPPAKGIVIKKKIKGAIIHKNK